VKKIYQVTHAQVPLIKFEFRGVYIDMMFASIESPAEPLTASTPCDEKSLWSLNGIQVADYFYNKYRDDIVFKLALRSVKQWAINNGIYRSVFGYLSGKIFYLINMDTLGVTCAILVGKIHQLYPFYSAS
jgi:poly(A) polymerase